MSRMSPAALAAIWGRLQALPAETEWDFRNRAESLGGGTILLGVRSLDQSQAADFKDGIQREPITLPDPEAVFIAHSRRDVAALLAEVERLRHHYECSVQHHPGGTNCSGRSVGYDTSAAKIERFS